jgi:hypothetical protein
VSRRFSHSGFRRTVPARWRHAIGEVLLA